MMKMGIVYFVGRKKYVAVLCAATALSIHVQAATWSQTGTSGEYDWNDVANWVDGAVPTASTDADFKTYVANSAQTVIGDGEAACFDLKTGDKTRTRRFTGKLSVDCVDLRVGRLRIDDALTIRGAGRQYSRIGTSFLADQICATLDIYGTVAAEGGHALRIGLNDDANLSSSGRIRLREGGRLLVNTGASTSSTAGLLVGHAGGASTAGFFASSYVQDGGYAKLGRLIVGYEKNAAASVTILGGVLEMPWISDDTRFRIGQRGYGVFQQLGGEVYVNTNHATGVDWEPMQYGFGIGSGFSKGDGLKSAYAYLAGGTFLSDSDFNIQTPPTAESRVAPAHATIDGSSVVTSLTVRVGANAGDGYAALNLNGGTLVTRRICRNKTRGGPGVVNANGGTVVFPENAIANQFLYIDAVNVYSGGLTIRCERDMSIGSPALPVRLRTPVGYVVASIAVTNRTAGTQRVSYCHNPPRIDVSGGSGSNATAVALIDYDAHQMTNIVVACGGEGYAEGDELTVTVIRQDSSTAQTRTDFTVVSLTNRVSGSLVKTGVGTLSVYSQPEFAGSYEVREGVMAQSTATNGSPSVSSVVVGGVGAAFRCGSVDDGTAKKARWNPVNPAAALTLGTSHGPGALWVPGAADGETEPFEQSFASLAVVGTGNEIARPPEDSMTGAVKVTFGTVECAAGSRVVIPDHKSSFKVYVMGMPPETILRNVGFAGKSPEKYAMVAEDGQIVPAAIRTMMIVR